MGLKKFREYVGKSNVEKIWNRLSDDFIDQWHKGNRGNHGEWK
jgi:hypothetical protein